MQSETSLLMGTFGNWANGWVWSPHDLHTGAHSIIQIVMKVGGLGKIFGFKNLVEMQQKNGIRKTNPLQLNCVSNYFLPD